MNKDNAKDYLPLVQALAEGKTIQCMAYGATQWNDIASPAWDMLPARYRIKPEPVKGWYRVALFKGDVTWSVDNETAEKNFGGSNGFVRWLTDRIEYEVEA